MNGRSRLVALVLAVVALLAAGATWACVLAPPGTRVATSAVVVPTVIVLVLHRGGRRPTPASALLLPMVGAVVAWPLMAPPGGRSYADLAAGVVGGWNTILGANVAVPSVPDAAAFAYACMALATAVTMSVAVRTRTRIWPMVPPMLVTTVAYMLGRGAPGSVPVATAVLVLATIAFVLLRSRAAVLTETGDAGTTGDAASGRDIATLWSRREVIAAVATVIALSVVAVAAVNVVPGLRDRGPRELHDDYQPEPTVVGRLNPLDGVARSEVLPDDEVEVLFAVALGQPFPACSSRQVQACPTFPIAYLDSVDAAGNWYASADLRAASGTVARPSAETGPSRTVEQVITVEPTYRDRTLPALGRLVEVSDPGAQRSGAADPVTGLRAYEPGARVTYEARSSVPDLRTDRLQRARADRAARTGGTRVDLTGFENLAALDAAKACAQRGDRSPDVERLCALEAEFITFADASAEDRPKGHSLFALERLLSGDDPKATSEQFAVAFADIASRTLPTRIAVGYRAVTGDRQFVVRENDLRAWPEVALDGLGWVAFSPFPGQASTLSATTTTTSTTQPLGSSTSTSTTVPDGQQSGSTGVQRCTAGSGCELVPAEQAPARPPVVLLTILGVVALAGALAAPGVIRARRRRRARTAGDPAQRVAAAWTDALDRLREEGVRGTACMTTRRATEVVEQRFGSEASDEVAALGGLTDRALHAPVPPTDTDATAAWDRADRLRDRVDATRPPVKRALRRVTPALARRR